MSNNNESGNGGGKRNYNKPASTWKQQGGGSGEHVEKEVSNAGAIREFPILIPNKADGRGSNFHVFRKLFVQYVF
jgi:hypothetical protein